MDNGSNVSEMTLVNKAQKYQSQEVGVFDDAKTALGKLRKGEENVPSNASHEFYSNDIDDLKN